MSTLGTIQLLFIAIALVMAGLGLSLQLSDFKRVAQERRAVTVALVLQLGFTPVVAYLLATAFDLAPAYAVGLMLIASAPGSVSSSIYSSAFGGNVALSMTLTAVYTSISMVTMPAISSWAIGHFTGADGATPEVAAKLGETMLTLVVPVGIGMVIRARAPAFALRAQRPMQIFSLLVLIAFSVGAIFKEWKSLMEAYSAVGMTVVLFNLLSLGVGYSVALQACKNHATAVAIAFDMGVRSAVLSIYVAMTTLQSTQIALPSAVYSVTMVIFGLSFGVGVKRMRQTWVRPVEQGLGA